MQSPIIRHGDPLLDPAHQWQICKAPNCDGVQNAASGKRCPTKESKESENRAHLKTVRGFSRRYACVDVHPARSKKQGFHLAVECTDKVVQMPKVLTYPVWKCNSNAFLYYT